ncbi:gephyrin-like molybdotransferase receptor GlpR [Corynebacterium parakroppenstedtii]|uniref:divisome protein SepX/GlpR n=1 Tax=Corynebacterium parakroppenstedtii TaxID=2828363 RepID=UPI0030EE229F
MSSSLLIVLIVVLWLAVLAPLLLRNQGPVRRTSKALKETRVLYRGGSGSVASSGRLTKHVRRRSASPDVETEPAEDEYRLLDEDDVHFRAYDDRGAVYSGDAVHPGESDADDASAREVHSEAHAGEHVEGDNTRDDEDVVVGELEPEDSDQSFAASSVVADDIDDAVTEPVDDAEFEEFVDDVEDEPDGAPGEAKDDQTAPGEKSSVPVGVVDGDVIMDSSGAVQGVPELESAEAASSQDRDSRRGSRPVSVDEESADDVLSAGEDRTSVVYGRDFGSDDVVAKDRERFPDAYDRPEDVVDYRDGDPAFEHAYDFADESDDEREERRETQKRSSTMLFDDGLDALSDEELEELARSEYDDIAVTDEDRAYVDRRRGRGVYDPELAQRNARRRFTQRKRVLFGLAAVTVVLLVLGFVVGGAMWAGAVVGAVATGVYLAFLRKQAIEEQRLAARRLRRMRRARMGVRNAEDDHDDRAVSSRLRRPAGTVIETNDTDPELAELEYVDAADYFGVEEPDDMQDDGEYIDRQYDRYETDGDGRASVTHIRRVG